jgi:hypothetical protein
MAADLGIEDLQRVGVGWVPQDVALRLEDEAGRLHFPDDRSWIDAVQRVGIAKA